MQANFNLKYFDMCVPPYPKREVLLRQVLILKLCLCFLNSFFSLICFGKNNLLSSLHMKICFCLLQSVNERGNQYIYGTGSGSATWKNPSQCSCQIPLWCSEYGKYHPNLLKLARAGTAMPQESRNKGRFMTWEIPRLRTVCRASP